MTWWMWFLVGLAVYVLIGAFMTGVLAQAIEKENSSDQVDKGCFYILILIAWPIGLAFLFGVWVRLMYKKARGR